jgi:anthranilate phosphoribosyltransferase
MTSASHDRFARFIATLGRGPGRSRALTRAEAREAFALVLAGEADPHQVGAFLMLLRYRGEDPEEVTGLVEAARASAGLPDAELAADLDWPSYGAGRTRGAPWFLLAALALAQSGVRVLMHGSNAFSGGISVEDALAALGLRPAENVTQVGQTLRVQRYAYLPIRYLAPSLERLLGLRHLFGLRSPVNTVARLLDPAAAPASVDGVFHPAYIDVHLGVAERMRRPRLLVLKGGGGEAERNPAKPIAAHLWQNANGRTELLLPPYADTLDEMSESAALLAAVWRGEAAAPRAVATVRATIAVALLAAGLTATPATADSDAEAIWAARRA